uniref:Uncharacterized protein n=1 Tax=Plectus sambesii TaxID=2011161 RepID=A0A914WSR6_9BILA
MTIDQVGQPEKSERHARTARAAEQSAPGVPIRLRYEPRTCAVDRVLAYRRRIALSNLSHAAAGASPAALCAFALSASNWRRSLFDASFQRPRP